MIDFAPFQDATRTIQLHTAAAILALALTGAQLCMPKGTRLHRWMGWSWILLMATAAISSLFISTIKLWGPFSPIHLLVPVTLYSLYEGWRSARQRNIRQHKKTMLTLVIVALGITGALTLLPGRLMHEMLIGN